MSLFIRTCILLNLLQQYHHLCYSEGHSEARHSGVHEQHEHYGHSKNHEGEPTRELNLHVNIYY